MLPIILALFALLSNPFHVKADEQARAHELHVTVNTRPDYRTIEVVLANEDYTRVSQFDGGLSLYLVDWRGVPTGTYVLQANALDRAGSSVQSNTVTLFLR